MNDIIRREQAICAHTYNPLPVVIAKGEGVWVWDVDGKRYIDMIAAYSALSHGHRHPKIIAAAQQQLDTLCMTSKAVYTDKLAPFLEKACEISGMERIMPLNSGVEAVEAAIKGARKWGYEVKGIPDNQAEIIVARNCFHGRTVTATSMSSISAYYTHFGPLTPGFIQVDFGNIESLRAAINSKTCAVLLEPIQGEAGIIIPPDGYLKAVADICKQNNVLLLFDEVQSGLGRTGKMFAHQYEDIKPDGLILGKALGGGVLPVSAFLAKAEVMDLFTPGTHGSTWGGNPLAAAVGYAALDVLVEEDLVQKSHDLGLYFHKRLDEIRNGIFIEIRSRGLWAGIDIDPEYGTARDFCLKLLEKGVMAKDTHKHTIRMAPPLVITKDEIDMVIEAMASILP